jgi:predicted lipase
VLVFRGTSGFEGWFSNLNALQSPWSEGGMVHTGFRNDFSKLWEDIRPALSERNTPVFYTGHSLGGAFATLAASKRKPDAVYTFGSPRVGDAVFAESVKDISICRIVNNRDIVATVPPSVIPFDFCHTGKLRLLVSANGSGHYKPSKIPAFLADHAPINYTARIEASHLATSGCSFTETEIPNTPTLPAE